MLHHTPNLDSKPIPGERGFFDWVYLSLFESTPNSRVLWGGFLKYPISQNILEDFKTLSEEELLNHYFRHNGEWMDLKRSLIKKMNLQIEESEQIKGEKPFATKKTQSEAEVYQYALLPAVYFSLFMKMNTKRSCMMQCLVNIIKRHNTIADLFVPVLLVMWIAIQNIPGITVIGGFRRFG